MTESGLSPACRKLLDQEQALFQDEYQKHYLSGETKAPDIGAPFLLHHPKSRTAVLLIHGLMAAPYEVREWAEDFFSRGYTVYAPRLAGHGTSAKDLASRNYGDWVDSVERGYGILASCCERVIVAGFSTGGGLALYQAIRHPKRYRAVISVSAPMKFKGLSSKLSETMERWNRTAGMLKLDSLQKSFARNHPDNPEINYHRCPIHAFNQVKALMRKVHRDLPGITVPLLVIQGNQDPKVSPKAGRMIFDRVRTPEKHYVEIEYPLHGIVRGEIGASVFNAVNEFLSGRT
ncbi:MAG: alpha/beta fold hydrolase [Desulfosalsimonadaceae bacterium]|nr:alpha/beta fold hydrolase [Desulfosalsimonadaceae bacterium]